MFLMLFPVREYFYFKPTANCEIKLIDIKLCIPPKEKINLLHILMDCKFASYVNFIFNSIAESVCKEFTLGHENTIIEGSKATFNFAN